MKSLKLARKIVLLVIILVFWIFPEAVFAQVVINEFAPKDDPEWVELYNNSDENLNLSNWKIVDGNNQTTDDLTLDGCIISKGSRLFTSPKGWLNDGGSETISLKNAAGAIVDQVTYGEGGIVGIPDSGKSGGRFPDGTSAWQIIDSPNPQNDICELSDADATPTFTPTPLPTNTSIPTVTSTPTSYSGIYINEYLPDPENGNEKVEIKNANSFSVSLINWQIDDVENGGGTPKTFSAEVSPSGLYTIDLGTGSFLNNDGDSVRLLDFSGIEKDKKDYSSSTKNSSWAKDRNGNWCQQTSTFNSENPDCSSPTSVPTNTPTPTPVPTSTPTIKLTPTPTKTPTPKLSGSPTPTGGVLGEESASESGGFKLTGGLTEGENEENVQLPGQEKKKSLFPLKIQWSIALPFMAVIVGVGFVSFSVVSFLKSRKQQKIIV